MKNFLLILSIAIVATSCLQEEIIEEGPAVSPAEQIDFTSIDIFGTWELLNSGPLSCEGDLYTFRENNNYTVAQSVDCEVIPIIEFIDSQNKWSATEDSLTLHQIPLTNNNTISTLYTSQTYTIITRSEDAMKTSTPLGEIFEYQDWKKRD